MEAPPLVLDLHTSEPASAKSEELEKLRQDLFKAAGSNDTKSCKTLLSQVSGLGKKLRDADLRDPDTNATVLHAALEGECHEVVALLLEDDTLLMEDFEVRVKGLPSKKTCLHILTEKGSLEITKQFLGKIPSGPEKNAFLRRTVLMELEGQRPRHLSSIHIAALKGHTELVELLVKLGIDVGFINNKKDTPVLWAARGKPHRDGPHAHQTGS